MCVVVVLGVDVGVCVVVLCILVLCLYVVDDCLLLLCC